MIKAKAERGNMRQDATKTTTRPALLRLYSMATALFAPFAPRLVRSRLAKGKEHAERHPERLGHATRARPEGLLVWFHAASVGESLSLLPLIDRLLADRPTISVMVTSTTLTASQMMEKRLPARAFHQFVPLDVPAAVARFLDHWRPDLGVWVESELWPGLILGADERGIPLLLLNARISERSAQRWQKIPAAAQAILSRFDRVLAQDEATRTRLLAMGLAPERVTVSGSTKESAPPAPVNAAQLQDLRAQIGTRPVWCAASIHAGEEQQIAQAQAAVLARHPDALLILAPRHADKLPLFEAALAGQGLRYATRSLDAPITPDTQVYIADTLGEMGLWFSLAPISFVGGSFVPVGGHNPFEPLLFGAHVLHGPLVANFAAYYAEFDASGATAMVENAQDLGAAVTDLISRGDRPAKIAPPQAAVDHALAAIGLHLPAQA